MSPPTDPSERMWMRAVELLGEAERLHRQFFHFSGAEHAVASWQPPADVFEDEREIVIVVAMPGVSANRVQVISEQSALLIRGARALPLQESHRVVQLEIPYGVFERRIPMPTGQFQLGDPQMIDGCLVLRLTRLAETRR